MRRLLVTGGAGFIGSAFMSKLGWRPQTNLELGLRHTIRHFQEALCIAARQ